MRSGEDGLRPALWAGPVAAAASGQAGAALGATMLPLLGTSAVVGLRQTMAAIVLLPALLGPRHPVRWLSPWGAGLLGLLVIGMNVTAYEGIEHIGLGLTVALQFLGPPAVALLGSRRLVDVGCGVGPAAGLLSSALPYALDIAVLRGIPQRLFGILQSVHPAAAPLTGLVMLLGERLSPGRLAGLVLVSAANVVAVAASGRPRRATSARPEATP